MAKNTLTGSPHIYKVLSFDDDIPENNKHCELSIVNEKGDSKYYRGNKLYKDNERKYPDQKTKMVERNDTKTKNVVKRDHYLSLDDSGSYSYIPRNHGKKDYAESHYTKHRRYSTSDSNKSENIVCNYRDSCLSHTSTESSTYGTFAVGCSSNNRKLNPTNKQIPNNGKQINISSQDHRRRQSYFREVYEDNEISSIYSFTSKCTTENEIENSHRHHNRKTDRPIPKISTKTGTAIYSDFPNSNTCENPKPFVTPQWIPHQNQNAQTQKPKQIEYDRQSKRNKTVENQPVKRSVNLCTTSHDQRNTYKQYTDLHDKESTSHVNSHKQRNVVITEPSLDYTNNELNNRNDVEKGNCDGSKSRKSFTDLDGPSRLQKPIEVKIGTSALPRNINRRPNLLFKILFRKRRKRRSKNINISFHRRKRRRRRLKKGNRNYNTSSSKPVQVNYTKDTKDYFEVRESKGKNESNKCDNKDSKTDQSINSNSLIESLKSSMLKICKYQIRRRVKNRDRTKKKACCKHDMENNHKLAELENKITVKMPFRQSENNCKYQLSGAMEMNVQRSLGDYYKIAKPNSIPVHTEDNRILTHEIPCNQCEDNRKYQIINKFEMMRNPNNNRQTPVQAGTSSGVKDIHCVESGKVDIEYGDTNTNPDQIKTVNNKAAKSPCNVIRSLCKYFLACIFSVLWSPCLLALGLCWLITYPVRPTKPAGQCRNIKFSRAFGRLRRNKNQCCLQSRRRRKFISQRRRSFNANIKRISTAKHRIPHKIKRNYQLYSCSIHHTRNSKPNEKNKPGVKSVRFPSELEYSERKMKPLRQKQIASKLCEKHLKNQNSSEGKRRNKCTEVKKTTHKEICDSSLSKLEQISKGEMEKGPKVSAGCKCSSTAKAVTDSSDKNKKVTFSWQKAKNDISSCSKDHTDSNKVPKGLVIRDKVPTDRNWHDMVHKDQKFTCSCDKTPKDYSTCDKVKKDPGSLNMVQKILCACGKAPKDYCDCSKVPIDPGLRNKVTKDRGSRNVTQNTTYSGKKVPEDSGSRNKVTNDRNSPEKVHKGSGFSDNIKIVIHRRDKLPKDRSHDLVQKRISSYEKVPKDPNPRGKVLEDGLREKEAKSPGTHDRVLKDRDPRDKVQKDINSWYNKEPKNPGPRHKLPDITNLRDNVPKDRSSRDKTKVFIYLSDRESKDSCDKVHKDRDLRDMVQKGICLNDKPNDEDRPKDLCFKDRNPRDEASVHPDSRDIEPNGINSWHNRTSKDPGLRDKALEDSGFHDNVPNRCSFKKVLKDRDIELKDLYSHDKVCDMEQKLSFSRDRVSENPSFRDKVPGDKKFTCSCGKEPKDHCSCDRPSCDIVPKIIRRSREKLPKDQKVSCSCGKVLKDHCECDKVPQDAVSHDRAPKDHASRDKVLKDYKFTCSCGKEPQVISECNKGPKNRDSRDDVPKNRSSRDTGPKFTISDETVPKNPDSRMEVPNDQKFTYSCDMTTKYCHCPSDKKIEDPGSRGMEQNVICVCDKVPKNHCDCYKVPKDLVSYDEVPKDGFSRDMVRKVTFSSDMVPRDCYPPEKVPKDPDPRDMIPKLSCWCGKVHKHRRSHEKHKLNIPEKRPKRDLNTRKSCKKYFQCNKRKRTKSKADLNKRKTNSVTNFFVCRVRKWKEELNPLIDCNLASYKNCQKYLEKAPPRYSVRSGPNLSETLGHCLNIIICFLGALFCLPCICFCQICCRLLCYCK